MTLQDKLLSELKRRGAKVKVILLSGKTLEGEISSFDNFTILLREGKNSHLLYKHAISSLSFQEKVEKKEIEKLAEHFQNR